VSDSYIQPGGKSIRSSFNAVKDITEDDFDSHTRADRPNPLSFITSTINKRPVGRLILVRHGESEMNANLSFTGWIDTDITERGKREMEHAARLLTERGYTDVDLVYTSILKRSIRSSWVLLKEINQIFRPVYKSWRLNQRMYGAIEGMSRDLLINELGEEKVEEYRNNIFVRPPPMSSNHPYWHLDERKYEKIRDELPLSESIADCFDRVVPLYKDEIVPELMAGKTVMVVGHLHSIRGIMKYIDNLSNEEIEKVVIPNGSPVVYKFNRDMSPVKQPDAIGSISSSFLEDKKIVNLMIEKEKKWGTGAANEIKGLYSLIDYSTSSLMATGLNPISQVLSKLNEERANLESHSNETNVEIPVEVKSNVTILVDSSSPASSRPIQKKKYKNTKLEGPFVIFIRHGKTEYNKLGIFTGWDDAPLADEGREGASKAGKILKLHGIEFDVVYTSWLSRAIETAWLVLDELNLLWLPLIKSWRLNERMYGALTGMSKKGIAEKYGFNQFKAWRRGYAVRPPQVSLFSMYYPGNDDRYMKYIKDMRVSISQTLFRSFFNKKFEIHRKFPQSESLKDCMKRTIPYYTDVIVPDSIKKGKRVLVASSENAIRGLLMHLCEIPTDRIHEIDIPNSVPLVFDLKKKCIYILDDGEETDEDFYNPLRRYSFGESPELLFKPCDFDGENADQCFIGENGKSFSYDPILRLVPEDE